jgi:hypothetical protein
VSGIRILEVIANNVKLCGNQVARIAPPHLSAELEGEESDHWLYLERTIRSSERTPDYPG